MILIGELEYTNKMMAPDGNTGWLWVSKQGDFYTYAISPYPESEAWHIGDIFRFAKMLSVNEFLQQVVNEDDMIGREVFIRYGDDVGIRLKGMENWIKRQ